VSEGPSTQLGPRDDLWTALLDRLTPTAGQAATPAEARSTLQACAAEVQQFAEREQQANAQDALRQLAALLGDVSGLIDRSERRWTRLGFDLHDSVLQEVAALRMLVSAFHSGSLREPTAQEHLDALFEQLDNGLQSLDRNLRELVETFETPRLAEEPLEESVRAAVSALESTMPVSVSVELDGDFRILSRSQRIALVRILSETLANIRKHADATRAWVAINVSGGRARLRVRDNGRGFDSGRARETPAGGRRLGLVGMVERARLLGGRCEVSSRPGGPTTITVVIPAGRVQEPSQAPLSPAGETPASR
jgi:signal transduction histidine kinase